MTTFDDRENAYENKFAHDEELAFKAQARCNKLLGLWAADLLGKSDDESQAYAKEIVMADFEEPGQDDVIRRLVADLGEKSDRETIAAKMAEFLEIAKDQILREV